MQYWYITGTGSGLGKSIAEKAIASGYTVTGISRHSAIQHKNYIHFTADLSDPEQAAAFQFSDHPDAEKIVLINNAGTLTEVKYTGELKNESIIAGYHLNIIAPHLLMNQFIKMYADVNCEKIIVNISSGAATTPYDGWSIYSSSKAALAMMSNCVAKEQHIRKGNFRILSVVPGVMDTAMQDTIRTVDKEDFSRLDKFTDLKKEDKLVSPEEVAEKMIRLINNADKIDGVEQNIR